MSKSKKTSVKRWVKGGVIALFAIILLMSVLRVAASHVREVALKAELREVAAKEAAEKTQNLGPFIVYPGEKKVIETNGRNYEWDSKTLMGLARDQEFRIILFIKGGKELEYRSVRGQMQAKFPDDSLVTKVMIEVHPDGLPEEFREFLIM